MWGEHSILKAERPLSYQFNIFDSYCLPLTALILLVGLDSGDAFIEYLCPFPDFLGAKEGWRFDGWNPARPPTNVTNLASVSCGRGVRTAIFRIKGEAFPKVFGRVQMTLFDLCSLFQRLKEAFDTPPSFIPT